LELLPVGFDPDDAPLLWWDGHLARYSTGKMPVPLKLSIGTPSRKVTAEGTQCVTKLTKWNFELEVHYLFLLEKGPPGVMWTIYEVLRFALTANVRTDIVNISSERLFLLRISPRGPVSV
jgi:hypothetical protein